MNKLKEKHLTRSKKTVTVGAMPPPPESSRSKRVARKSPKDEERTSEELYRNFFVPAPSPLWKNDDDNFSLEQPSPFKWVPSETTYGVGHIL